MSGSTANVFGEIYAQVSDVVNHYLNEWDPELFRESENEEDDSGPTTEEREAHDSNTAPDDDDADSVCPYMRDRDMGGLMNEFSGSIQLIKASFEDRVSTLPATHQANLFDKAVARAVLQRIPDTISEDNEDEALVELTYKMTYSLNAPETDGTLSLETLIREASTKLMGLRTELVTWLRENDEFQDNETWGQSEDIDEIRKALYVHERIVCFMAVLYGRLWASRRWRHTAGVAALGLFGFGIARNIMNLVKDPMLPDSWHEILFRVVLVWMDKSGRFFIKELLKQPDRQELYEWRNQFVHFFGGRENSFWNDPGCEHTCERQVTEIMYFRD